MNPHFSTFHLNGAPKNQLNIGAKSLNDSFNGSGRKIADVSLWKIRPQVIEKGKTLIAAPSYPDWPIIIRLAEILSVKYFWTV